MTALIARVRLRLRFSDQGLTLIEMVITLSLIAITFTGLAGVLAAALGAHSSARLRSAFIEIGSSEVESLRAQAFNDVGVHPQDPNYGAAYPSGKFDGRDAVLLSSSSAPPAVSAIANSSIKGITLPYTIRRWITWTDAGGGTGHVLKRFTVQVEWRDRNNTRNLRLVSVRYPGGLGANVSSNQAPQASFTAAPTTVTQGMSVALDGTASFDPDGDPLTYQWNFGDGQTLTGPSTTTHIFTVPGTAVVQLTVQDNRGGSNTAIREVTVVSSSGNSPPTASFSLSPSSGAAPLGVNFDASASTDPNGSGDIVSYSWNWADGSAAGNGITATHTFSSAGTFAVVLTVTDRGGLTSTQSHSVSVTSSLCDVTDGYMRNPESNTRINDVAVDNSGKPNSRSFFFFAISNSACTSLTARITHSSGTLTVPLVLQTNSGGVKTWSGTGSLNGNDRFSLGLNQTGEIRGPRPGQADEVFSFSFDVHR